MNKHAKHDEVRAVDSIQAYLAGYADELSYDSLSEEAVHAAKVSIIDTLGALIAGFDGEPCRIARTLAGSMLQDSGATILGTASRTTLDMAAFVNAILDRPWQLERVQNVAVVPPALVLQTH